MLGTGVPVFSARTEMVKRPSIARIDPPGGPAATGGTTSVSSRVTDSAAHGLRFVSDPLQLLRSTGPLLAPLSGWCADQDSISS